MPELPDVEVFRKYMDSSALHQKIKKVHVLDDSVLRKITPRSFQKSLKNRSFVETSRHGKYMFVKTDDEQWIMLHFGMTGFLKYYKLDNEKSDHIRILFDFSNDYHLAYDCQRKLGQVDLIKNQPKFIKEKKLGIDALSPEMGQDQFKQLLKDRRGSVKPALMNQQLICGIGNIYSDEILFHANLHPASKNKKLSDSEIRDIYNSMKDVLKTGIESQVQPSQMPENFLIRHRSEGEECPVCGGEIHNSTISGRSSYFCGKHQQKK